MLFSRQTVCVVLLTLTTVTLAQIPIPKRMQGYVFNKVSSDAPIHLDIHMGPLCPDSAMALPPAKEVAMHYGSKVRLTLHMFPLPYHHQAYLTAIGAHVIDHLTATEKTYDWFVSIYSDLDSISNDATMNMTGTQVLSLLATYAQKCCSVPTSEFLTMMAEEEFESQTRAAWKYSCSRTVSGTPTYFLNDVPIAAEQTWGLDEWKKVIDPLLAGTQASLKFKPRSNQDCKPGTKKCEYLPGKIECCTKGEACIPNVGCRC